MWQCVACINHFVIGGFLCEGLGSGFFPVAIQGNPQITNVATVSLERGSTNLNLDSWLASSTTHKIQRCLNDSISINKSHFWEKYQISSYLSKVKCWNNTNFENLLSSSFTEICWNMLLTNRQTAIQSLNITSLEETNIVTLCEWGGCWWISAFKLLMRRDKNREHFHLLHIWPPQLQLSHFSVYRCGDRRIAGVA